MWTKDKIQNLLRTSDRAVERACIAIYDRQMQDEKRSNITCHDNTIGFSSAHASKGSYYARWCLGGRHLNGIHLVKARAMMMHYHRQLCEIANSKNPPPPKGGMPIYGKPGVSKETGRQVPDASMSEFETRVNDYIRRTGQPRDAAESVVRNVMAGKCPDGCCGGDEEPMPGVNYEEEGPGGSLRYRGPAGSLPTQPPPGSWADIARGMVQLGVMDGDEADEWKDRMKDLEMEREV